MDEARQKNLLLVEDEFLIALNEQIQLGNHGYCVTTVNSGEKAIEAMEGNAAYDLILMDINLGGGLDGTEAAERILEHHDIPIVFLSSHMEQEVVEKTEKITSYGYVVKNSSITVLDASIKMAFKLFAAKKAEKDRERELAQREHYYRSIIQTASEGFCVINLEGDFVDVNEAYLRMSGYPREEFLKLNVRDIEASESGDEIRTHVESMAKNGSDTFETRHRGKDGRVFDVEVSATYLADDGGRLICLYRDISERKAMEAAMAESEEKYRNLFSKAEVGMFRSRLDGSEFLESNDKYLSILGMTREECIGRPTSILWADSGKRDEIARKLRAEGHVEDLECQLLRGDGKVITCISSLRLYPDTGILEGSIIDITERKELEVALQQKESRLQSVFNAMTEGAFEAQTDIAEARRAQEALRGSEERFKSLVWDMQAGVLIQGPHAEILMSNPQALELLGLSEDQLMGKTSFDPDWSVIHEDGSPFPGETHPVPQAIASLAPVRDVVMGVYRPASNSRVWLQVDAIPHIEDGELRHVICTFIDISKRIHAEGLLRESEEQHRSLINNTDDSLWSVDREYRLITGNDVFLHNTKAAGGGSLRKGDSVLMDSWPKEAIEQWKGLYDRVLEGEKIGMDIQRTRFTPEPRYMEYQFSPIYGEGGGIGGVSVHGRDITERKAAEMRIQGLLDEKEALVREINHRVKNTMSVIESLVSLHLQRLQDPAAVEALNDITGKIRSMRLLYEQLESTGNYQEAKLGSYLPGIVNEAVSVFPDSRKVKTEFQVEDFLLDVKTMSVVGIMASEIVTNAMKYAFQGREAGRIRVAASRSGKRVRISLSDDGIGIPEHAGFGSSKGLGMTLIKGFADQLGGSIRIERAQGSTFVLEFDTEKQKT